ncbi:MAG: puuD [Rhodospirillaceae bacterium]|nr:MAG: puuD [Rhodospirillaceae bacterium]
MYFEPHSSMREFVMLRPLIGVSACVKDVTGEEMLFHAAPEVYMTAIIEAAGGMPLVIPALGASLDPNELLGHVAGVLLTGSKSNVHPSHYGGVGNSRSDTLHDQRRDTTTVPLIRACVQHGVPLLAICRGIQELNVALGGTLYQHVHEQPGKMDHRSDGTAPLEIQFAPVHPVRLVAGGMLTGLAGATEVRVNSLHWQGIETLAPGLAIEALAPDGLIEAVRVEHMPYGVGVQWHPEWNWQTDLLSSALFRTFGEACRRHLA